MISTDRTLLALRFGWFDRLVTIRIHQGKIGASV